MSNVDQGLKDMVSVLQVHAEAVSACIHCLQPVRRATDKEFRNIHKNRENRWIHEDGYFTCSGKTSDGRKHFADGGEQAVSAVSVNQELLATLRIISLHIRHNWNPVPSDIRYIKSLADEAIRKAERAL